MKDTREAPTKDPTAGKLATAPLGEGAGASWPSWAITALMEAAAKRTAQAIFFISIAARPAKNLTSCSFRVGRRD
ncbi:hypothetical protein NL676_036634 [Syzygium grande]|nr:hypothetical protein NL676_036634 [Syzygium grande]